MATLTAETTLTSAFQHDSTEAIVHTYVSRSITTAYRNPVGGDAPVYDGGTQFNQNVEILFNDQLTLYVETNYVDPTYTIDLDGDADYIRAVFSAGSPNSPGEVNLYLYYDFLDIDPNANIANVEVQVALQSSRSGYTSYPPYGVQDELHYGKVQAILCKDGFGDTLPSSDLTKITTNEQTTITLTIEPDATYWPQPSGIGTHHAIAIKLQGIVNPSTSYPGSPANGADIKVYSVKARVNYTGRTRLITGFVSPTTITSTTNGGFPTPEVLTSSGYNFNLPSLTIVDGSAIRYGAVGNEDDGSGQTWVVNSHTFKISGSAVSTGDYDRTFGGPILYGLQDEPNWVNQYLAYDVENDVDLTRTEVNDSNLTLEGSYTATFNSELLHTPFYADVNIAYVYPFNTGPLDLDVSTTLTTTGNLNHNTTADELSTFEFAATQTTNGGIIRLGYSTKSSSFTLSCTANPFKSTTITPLAEYTLTPSASLQITRDATLQSAFSISTDSGVTYGETQDEIGIKAFEFTLSSSPKVIHQITSETYSWTLSSDTAIVRILFAPDEYRMLELATKSRIYGLPDDRRVTNVQQSNRIYIHPADSRDAKAVQQTRIYREDGYYE